MNVKTWLKQNKDIKKANIVLATVLKRDPAWLVTHEDYEIDVKEQVKADAGVKNLREGMPMGYVMGAVEFYGNLLRITRDVLIPRPETELVVDLALEAVKKIDSTFLKILDIGTGSGCIAISLAKKLPKARVYATDISPEALDLAMFNAKFNQAPVRFLPPTDLMRDFNPHRGYDVVVANLPYVNREWEWIDEKSLDYEPEIALYAEDEGLELIKELIDQIAERKIDKYLVLEADPCQHQNIINYAEEKAIKHLKTSGFGMLFGIKE